LIVLPEMFSSGFSMNATAVAEPPGGPTERWLTRTAGRLGLWILAGLARRDSRGAAANEALIAGPDGSLIATYRKQRPFSPGGEHLHYAAGRETLVFPWNDVRVATFICYDLRFSELFRQAARERPELYVVIASWPDRRIAHWLKLLQARAIENQAYVLGLNRVGSDPTHAYPGRSLLVDPWGEILQDAGDAEGLIDAELDLARLRDYRSKLPFLDDLA
jgi:predicted amidohydrolase